MATVSDCCIWRCCSTASSNAQPLAMLCATAPLIPAASSSDREARNTACGVRNRSISLPAFRRPGPEPAATPANEVPHPGQEKLPA